jgi:hypothetical protein
LDTGTIYKEGRQVGHIKFTEHRGTARTSPEWLPVGRTIGEIVNHWAKRDDIIAYVGENAGHGAPACYNPIIGEVEVDVEQAFGKMVTPEMVGDLHERSKQYEFATAMGALIHEAFHARYSLYSLVEAAEVLSPNEHQALMLIEESRIEAFGVTETPRSRVFVRSSALDLAIADAEEKLLEDSSLTVDNAAMLVALVHARVDADILTEEETVGLRKMVDAFLGEEVVKKLRDIIARAHTHRAHAYAEPLYALAREWVKVLSDEKEQRGESEQPSDDEMAQMMRDLMEAMGEARDTVEVLNQGELDDQERSEEWKDEVKKREEDASEQQESERKSKEVFGRATSEIVTTKSHSRLRETRKPRSEERVAAVTIANLLERAKYRERSEVEIASITPPGRLRTRALVQSAAMKSRGVHTPVEPWRRTVRKHTEDPTLTVGVLVDISGSMSAAMEPMATTAWVMSEAVRRVQGRAAMVYFGNDVFATLKPGEHLSDVAVYTAEDGTEKFDDAFRAIDGGLNLLHGSGARLLVVVSDGHYTGDEMRKAQGWLKRCASSGVGVLWLPFDSGSMANRVVGNYGRIVSGTMNPAEAASEIGRAAAEVLTRIGAAR